MEHQNIIIVTGRSGSGKSTAMAALEDAGFYCVDNLPVTLLPNFLKTPIEAASEAAGFAFVMDLREKGLLAAYPSVLRALEKEGYRFEVLFLEAEEKVLVRRYSQTRRNHPLARGQGLLESIRAEKELLDDLRKHAGRVIDTSETSVHELKSIIFDIVLKSAPRVSININILSFGFKFGVPLESDLIMDVRFLPNPYFIPDLRDMDGESAPVKDYVLNNTETRLFLDKFFDLLDYLIPMYEKERKAYLTIAVGCTGGRHRSVTVARALYDHIGGGGQHVEIHHRDINQD